MLTRSIPQESPTPLTPLRPTFNINHSTKGWPPCSTGWFEGWNERGRARRALPRRSPLCPSSVHDTAPCLPLARFLRILPISWETSQQQLTAESIPSPAPLPLPHDHRPLHRCRLRPNDPFGARLPVSADPAEYQHQLRPPAVVESQLTALYGPYLSPWAQGTAYPRTLRLDNVYKKIRQEPPAPPPNLSGHGLLQIPRLLASMFLFLRTQKMLQARTSRVPHHDHHTATDTPRGPRQHRPLPRRSREPRSPKPRPPRPCHTTLHGATPSPFAPPHYCRPWILPNLFRLGLLLGMFPVVHLGLHRRQ